MPPSSPPRRAAVVSASAAARLRGGYPWVWATDVVRPAPPEAGDVAAVTDERGRLIGTALVAGGGPIALRLFARGEAAFDGALLEARLRAALTRRRALFPTADAFRWVHAEADLLPGLVVDRYADVAVMQTTTRATHARRDEIAALVAKILPARLVVARDDGSARDFEGLPREARVLVGDGGAAGATEVAYHDAGNRYVVDVMTDGKTGGFLDQAENHARAAAYARGEALDAFTYHGGFALAMARGGATSVLALDESAAAVARARANAARNRLDGVVRVEQADAFDALRRLEGEGRRFDTIVVDPPALAKRRGGSLKDAERAYGELALRALRLGRDGAIVVVCSCSGRVTPALFGEIIDGAARASGRAVQLLERTGAGRDHPPLVGAPETEYLKCWWLRVLD
jgi:23S rRNA (cytosine1962-C5)-methyltransferase